MLEKWARLVSSSFNAKKPILFVFGFSRWKTFIRDWFPDHRVIIAPSKLSDEDFDREWKATLLRDKRVSVISWQYKGPRQLKGFCELHDIPFHYVEDGFVRSLKLGALHTPPMSLTFDRQDMYFAADRPTDLEAILESYDFQSDTLLIERTREAIGLLLSSGLSKYNSGEALDAAELYGSKVSKRILVIGQVENDASIAYGCKEHVNNNDLVRIARRENPNADIIYKPHPEVLSGIAAMGSNPMDVRSIARILDREVSLDSALQSIDQVYTITSLSGFEALLRGIKVTTIGSPFYAGWGLTDDRQPNPRRSRRLSVEEVFAAAYILYPKYLDPITCQYVEIEDALGILAEQRKQLLPANNDLVKSGEVVLAANDGVNCAGNGARSRFAIKYPWKKF